jgi:Zn-dependent M28 family amino/carboxypeptidase
VSVRSFLVVAAVASVLAVACSSGSDEAASTAAAPAARAADELAQRVSAEGLKAHLTALQRIADANGGTRASGTPGYEASVEYVAGQLRRAGYTPRLERVRYMDSRELAPPELARVSPDPVRYSYPDDLVSLRYSGSGEVEAPLEPVDADSETSGCEPSDFDDFHAGSIALIRRGGCFFFDKVRNAVSAGAAAVIVFNDGSPGHVGPIEATLLRPVAVPAISLAHEIGELLVTQADAGPVRVRVQTTVQVGQTEAANVLADLPGATKGAPLLLGAHLDSVQSGPGINDNGSGVTALLELAVQARKLGLQPDRPVRFAFWAGEEAGEFGSREYVASLGDPSEDVASVVNVDMIGSPHPEPYVYEGDGTIQGALNEAVRAEGLDPVPVDLEGRSDHAPFEEAGIPVGGLYTGADEPAPDGQPHDDCYHRACDSIDNVDLEMLEQMADALATAVFGTLTAPYS